MIVEVDAGDESWLLTLAKQRIDAEWLAAVARAAELRRRNAGLSDDRLANRLIEDSAFWAAIVGAGVGAAASIPAVGAFGSAGSVAPELVYLTRLEFDTALGVAAIYDSQMPRDMLVPTLLACLVYSLGHDFAKSVVLGMGVNLTRRAVEQAFRGATLVAAKRIARHIGMQATKKGFIHAVPLVAIPINAAANYAGLELFGIGAKLYFSPNWRTCEACGHAQPKRNRFCAGCAKIG